MKQKAFQVTDGDQVRLMGYDPTKPVIELGADQGVIESSLQKYLDMDEDLDNMEQYHFYNWAAQWTMGNFEDSKYSVEWGEVETA